MTSFQLSVSFILLAFISQAAIAQGTVTWEKEAAQQEIDGMRRYAWALSGATADALGKMPAGKSPVVHAFLREFDEARKGVDPEKAPSEWKTIDVGKLAIRNPTTFSESSSATVALTISPPSWPLAAVTAVLILSCAILQTNPFVCEMPYHPAIPGRQ